MTEYKITVGEVDKAALDRHLFDYIMKHATVRDLPILRQWLAHWDHSPNVALTDARHRLNRAIARMDKITNGKR